GRSTFTPCWSIGAVTMKMMSNTSITSTSGVTLISAIPLGPPLLEPAIPDLLGGVPLDEVEEVGGEIAHLAIQHPDARDELVVEDERRDRDEEADRRGDQRLGDGLRDRREVGVALRRNLAEGAHDPPDRPEETDEG